MKKVLFTAAATMCLGMVLGMTACSNTAGNKAKNDTNATVSVQTEAADEKSDAAKTGAQAAVSTVKVIDVPEAMPLSSDTEVICGADENTWSPFTDCKSLKEAEEVVGFDMSVPDKIDDYDDISYSAMKRYRLIQIDYRKDENRYVCIRKAFGNDDISGDYNKYNSEVMAELDGRQVTFKGNDDKVSLATWTDGDYTYSVMYADLADNGAGSEETGVSAEQMKELVSKVK